VDGGNLIDSNNPTIFELVDQTDGSVQERYWNFNGNGKVIKNFYKILSVSDPDIFIESRFIKEINPDNDIAFVYIKDGNVITKIIKILSVSGSGDGKITLDGSIEDTGSIKYLGVILPETVSTYTEKDPNVHSIHFMYESAAANSKYNPSVFILFKNQYIKKTFLKEQIVID
jgi:hypothetical protein